MPYQSVENQKALKSSLTISNSQMTEPPGRPDLTINMYKIHGEVTHHKAVLTITIIKGSNSQEFERKEQSTETAKSEFLKASNR